MEDVKRHKLDCNELEVYSPQEEVERKILRGRIFVDSKIKRTTFVENEKRGPRSTCLSRTTHGILRRNSAGDEYKITLRFRSDEKYLKELLLSEIRSLVEVIEGEKI